MSDVIDMPRLSRTGTLERELEEFCIAHGVSGLFMLAQANPPPGARPEVTVHTHILRRSDPSHRVSFNGAVAGKLIEFRQWLRGILASH